MLKYRCPVPPGIPLLPRLYGRRIVLRRRCILSVSSIGNVLHILYALPILCLHVIEILRAARILDRPLRLSRIPLRLLRLNKTAPVLSLRGPGSSGSVSCISHNPGTGSAFCGILLLPAPLLVLRPLLRRVLLSAV